MNNSKSLLSESDYLFWRVSTLIQSVASLYDYTFNSDIGVIHKKSVTP